MRTTASAVWKRKKKKPVGRKQQGLLGRNDPSPPRHAMSVPSPPSSSESTPSSPQEPLPWNIDHITFYFAPSQGRIITEAELMALIAQGSATGSLFERQVTFPPGSYIHVFASPGGLELTPANDPNAWLDGQRCLPQCQFRVRGKRPAVVRDHFINCRRRKEHFSFDPMAELCRLQREA